MTGTFDNIEIQQTDENVQGMDMMMMMYMWFWQGTEVTYLFKDIKSTSTGGYVLGLFCVALLAIILELLVYVQSQVKIKEINSQINEQMWENIPYKRSSIRCKVSVQSRLLQGFLYMIMVLTAYFVMLLVMTFNAGILVSVVLGLGFGNLMTRLWLPKETINANFRVDSPTYMPSADQCCCNLDEDV